MFKFAVISNLQSLPVITPSMDINEREIDHNTNNIQISYSIVVQALLTITNK